MLSGTQALVYSTQLQKSQCESLMEKQNFLAHQKYTNTASLRGTGTSPKEASRNKPDNPLIPLLSAASAPTLSIHSTPVTTAAGALLQGALFY